MSRSAITAILLASLGYFVDIYDLIRDRRHALLRPAAPLQEFNELAGLTLLSRVF